MSSELIKLLYKSQLKVYYQMYNSIELSNSNSFWYCFCEKVPGCRSEHGIKGWCLVCMLNRDEEFSIAYLNTIKKFPVKLAVFSKQSIRSINANI